VRIGVAATPSVAIPTLDWLRDSNHELGLVITRPDKPAGRGRGLKESIVGQWASAHGVECVKPVASEDLYESLAFLDLVVTIGYGVILPLEILSIPRFGFINLHFSLLPAWRGAAPVQSAILSGKEKTGVTVFALNSGMDTGPIYVQRNILMNPNENAGELLTRMAVIGPEVIAETLVIIESGTPPTPQDGESATYAAKISKKDARIAWNKGAKDIDRQIRAFTPEPGAWTLWRDSMLRIDRARLFPSEEPLTPGGVLVQGGHVMVGSGDGRTLILEEVTPAGKKTMSAKSWVNGARITKGEGFV
jgi:methionyl-tRNA formyltransferase